MLVLVEEIFAELPSLQLITVPVTQQTDQCGGEELLTIIALGDDVEPVSLPLEEVRQNRLDLLVTCL